MTAPLPRMLLATCIAIAGTFTATAFAQDKFPSRPIDMIVNFGPGGGADQLGRAYDTKLELLRAAAMLPSDSTTLASALSLPASARSRRPRSARRARPRSGATGTGSRRRRTPTTRTSPAASRRRRR